MTQLRRITGNKKGGGSGSGPSEAPTTLRSKSFARVQDLLGWGEWEGLVNGGRSIYIDNTPLYDTDGNANFKGLSWNFVNGLQNQGVIAGFDSVDTYTTVGTKITRAQPVVRTITNSDADHLIVSIRIPSLFEQTTKGDVITTALSLKVSVALNAGSYVLVKQWDYQDKCTADYLEEFIFALPRSGTPSTDYWNVKFERITPDAFGSVTLHNEVYWESYSEVVTRKLSYPNCVISAIEVDAENFNRIPDRSWHVKMRKVRVPLNYNPVTRTYATTGAGTSNGGWNGQFKTAYTNNPAWVYFDLLTDKNIGIGRYVKDGQLDKWTLYQIGVYCDRMVPDGRGGTEPLFTSNFYLQTREEALKVMNDLASCFRSVIYYFNGRIIPVQDRPIYDSFAAFTNGNVKDGSFTYTSTAVKARKTVATVRFNNPDNYYLPEYQPVMDYEGIVRYGYNEADVTAFACTSRGQAYRYGKLLLETEKREYDGVQFVTGREALLLRIGCILDVLDRNRALVRHGGRLNSKPLATLIYGPDSQFLEANWIYNLAQHNEIEGAAEFGFNDFPWDMAKPVYTPENTIIRVTVDVKLGTATNFAICISDTVTWDNSDGQTFTGLSHSQFTTVTFTGYGTVTNNSNVHLGAHDRTGFGQAQQSAGTLTLRNFKVENIGFIPTTQTVMLDAPVLIESGKTYSLSVVMPKALKEPSTITDSTQTPAMQASQLETSQVITSVLGSVNILRLVSPFSAIPEDGAVWVLTASDVAPRKFRVLSVKELGTDEYEVSGNCYDPQKFDASEIDPAFVQAPTTRFPTDGKVAPVSNIQVSVRSSVDANGIERFLDVGWTGNDPFGGRYRVTYITPRNETIAIPEVNVPTVTIPVTQTGAYQISITAVRVLTGQVSLPEAVLYDVQDANIVPIFRVTGLELKEQGVNTMFTGNDAKFVWRLNSPSQSYDFDAEIYGAQEVGTIDPYFDHFLFQVYSPLSNEIVFEDKVFATNYDFTYEKNAESSRQSDPLRKFSVYVTSVDRYGRYSNRAEITVENPSPAAIGCTVTPYLGGLSVKLPTSNDLDFTGYRIWASTVNNFTPSDANLAYDGPNTLINLNLTTNAQVFIRVAAYDGFGTTGLNVSAQFSGTPYRSKANFPVLTKNTAVGIAGTVQLTSVDAGATIWYIISKPMVANVQAYGPFGVVVTTAVPSTSLADGVYRYLGNYVGIQSNSGFTGTVYFEKSADNATWVACDAIAYSTGATVTSTAVAGNFSLNITSGYFRVRINLTAGAIQQIRVTRANKTTDETNYSIAGAFPIAVGDFVTAYATVPNIDPSDKVTYDNKLVTFNDGGGGGVGPAGQDGKDGVDGAEGPEGPQGPAGADGEDGISYDPAEFDALETRVGVLEGRATNVESRVTATESDISTLQSLVDGINNRLDSASGSGECDGSGGIDITINI